MSNALASETSPYLRAHAHNPVDWLPWGEQALARARVLDRPLMVSIGYAACHWCHVMERESFEDPGTAALLNEHFVAVKVDREERPDLDGIYMDAVQTLTGHGGWPLTVFLTPDQEPFFGGTYWPPEPRNGMASFNQVLEAVAELWRERRDEALLAASRLTERLSESARRDRGKPIRLTRARWSWRWRACAAPSTLTTAASAARRSSRRTARSSSLPAPASSRCRRARCGRWRSAASATRSEAASRVTRVDAGLDRAPLREDALRQRAACPRLSARVAGEWRAALRAHLPRDARLLPARAAARPRVASTPHWTPTPRGSRAASTSGPSRSCGRSSASSPRRRSPTSAPASGATSRARTSCEPTARSRRSARRSAPACWPRAPGAFAPRSTTSG